MGNPTVPAQAALPISPPLAKLPIGYVDPSQTAGPNGTPNVLPTLQFLKQWQELWAAVGGTGGTGGLIISLPWTPILSGKITPGSQTYLNQWGRYVSAGALALVLYNIKLSAFDAATNGNMEIKGLPITANNDASAIQAAFMGSWGGVALLPAYSSMSGRIASASQTIDLYQSGNGSTAAHNGAQPLNHTQFAANTEIIGGAIYIM